MDELFLAACDENGVAFCNKYIRKQFDVNVRDVNGCTGIMKACLRGNLEIVKMLIEAGADIHDHDRHNQNLLHYAVQSNNEKLCKFLLSLKLNTKEASKVTNLVPKSYMLRTVPVALTKNVGSSGVPLQNDPLDHLYLTQTREIKTAEVYHAYMDRGEAKFSEDKIYNMILRYEDMDLSDYESDGDITAGAKKKNEKKKKPKKAKAKAGGASGPKGKKGKKAKKSKKK